MSNKPKKHSEEKGVTSASRMKQEWAYKRRTVPNVPINPERHLIVTEGTKTEPLYFEAIRKRVNDRYHGQWVTIEIFGTGDHTLGLLERAVSKAEASVSGFSHVWIVYDKDSFPANEFNDVATRCSSLSANGVKFHAIWSNECFELWYILHFEYLQTPLPRGDYDAKVSGCLEALGKGGYTKSRDDMFDILEPYLASAKRNAGRLEKLNEGRTPADSTPGTKVHRLIDALEPFFRSDNRHQVR